MLKFKTSCAVLACLSSNLLNEVGLSLFRYFEVGLRVCDIVVKKFTFAISSPDEFLLLLAHCSQNSYISHGFNARLANRPFLVFDSRALALSVKRQSARKSKTKNGRF